MASSSSPLLLKYDHYYDDYDSDDDEGGDHDADDDKGGDDDTGALFSQALRQTIFSSGRLLFQCKCVKLLTSIEGHSGRSTRIEEGHRVLIY